MEGTPHSLSIESSANTQTSLDFLHPLIMKLFTAAVLAFLFFAEAARAQDVGEPCPADQAGDVGCANTPSVNNGNAYIFICNGEEFVLFADCASQFGCRTEGPKNAVCF
ncbi:hypothetical protein CPB84DRAFT_1766263 [Gymnopilus junonius]|uniref:Uncharacterized protein n=1 Tax=Gymnopilus junonius TaxID=109634 RepID=A0A9P5NYB7_GYMJU|nr:hypothetical protein CPB84DRAFT_1766263 [Gymnopilus junonius]